MKKVNFNLLPQKAPPYQLWVFILIWIFVLAALNIYMLPLSVHLDADAAHHSENFSELGLTEFNDKPKYHESAEAAWHQVDAWWDSPLSTIDSHEIKGVKIKSLRMDSEDKSVHVNFEVNDISVALEYVRQLNSSSDARWKLLSIESQPIDAGVQQYLHSVVMQWQH